MFAFFRHVGVHALCIYLRKVIGAWCYLCYLFFRSCVCVCVCLCTMRAEVGSRREDRRQLIFYPSPAWLSQGRLCHQLSACQRWVLLFQSTGQLTFLLSLLHLPNNTPWKKKLNRKGDAPYSLYTFALSFVLCVFFFIPLSLYPPEPQKMAQFLSCSTCYLLNKTLLLF